MKHWMIAIGLLFFIPVASYAQLSQQQIKEYLSTKKFDLDSEAEAIILFDSTGIDNRRSNREFVQVKSIHKIIKIVNKKGLSQADVKLFYPLNDYNNYIYKLKGRTYSLEGDSIIITSLPREDYYTKKVTKHIFEIDFTLPNVTEGCIIDYSYDIMSNRFGVWNWQIQEDLPKLRTLFTVHDPLGKYFKAFSRSLVPINEYNTLDSARMSEQLYSHCINLNYRVLNELWQRRNVPSIKDEPYVVNIHNHTECITIKDGWQNTWGDLDESIIESPVGRCLRAENLFLNDLVKDIIKKDTGKLAKAKAIYRWVRTNMKLNNASKTGDGQIKDAFYDREGDYLNINCLLGAMLNKAGLTADLLVLGTTNNISQERSTPIRNRTDYVVCALEIDSVYFFLDASGKNNPFGILPLQCYNGWSRVVAKHPDLVELSRTMLENKSTRIVNLKRINDSTQQIEILEKVGLLASMEMRNLMSQFQSSKDELLEKYFANVSAMYTFKNGSVANMDQPDTNIIMKAVFETHVDPVGSSYLQDFSFGNLITTHPFKNPNRIHPIEYPYRWNNASYFNIYLPPGYSIDSVTTPILAELGSDGLYYSRNATYNKDMNMISVTTVFKNNIVNYFGSENYQNIREFYTNILKDNNSTIRIKRTSTK